MRAFVKNRAAIRLFQLLVGLVVSLLGGEAVAMSSVAGMCDPIGASMPAPIPAMPARGGSIDVLEDCEQFLCDFDDDASTEDEASLETPQPGPKPAFLVAFDLLHEPGVRLPVPDVVAPPVRNGHAAGVFRPPRV